MKAPFATAGLSAMLLSLAVPALLLAQEPAAEPSGATLQAEQAHPVAESSPQATVERASTAKASATVDMIDYEFSPKTVTIDVGDTVTWSNIGEEDHDADGDGFGTGTLAPGDDGTESFDDAGTFKYVCTFHPDMKGTVVVEAASGGAGPDDDEKADVGTTAPATTTPTGTGSTFSSGTPASSSSLPSTGQNEIPLIIIGAGFLVCGLLAGAVLSAYTGP